MAKILNGFKKKSFWRNAAVFLAILGPGIITGSVDNDVGGITTYSVAGAQFGYKLLWTLIPAFIVLYVTQEMNARMGIVTGKGLADLIRENMGVKVTFFIFIFLLGADIMNTMTEFSGVAGSMQIFGVSKYISVPVVAVGVWFIVVKGTYRVAEKIFLVFCLALFVYVAAALLGKPDWKAIGSAIAKPDIESNFLYISTVIGLIGTTIAPWMQFYMQSSVIEKQLRVKDLKWSKLDVLIGCLCTVVVAFFIVVACASTLYAEGIQINDASDAAAALAPVAGAIASQVFAFGLLVAAIFSAVILPVATAFYVCEAFGYEAGIDKKWDEAPQFYWLYTAIIVISAGMILLPNAPLIQISLWSQRINGILLPVVMICMVLIVNKKDIMGKYVNRPVTNIISWVTIVILIALSATLVVSLFR
ncbi:NRAMP (natural resistance-associated macrophage protein) metal ion transporters [Sporobacter termitidis DSM 10068]|uniref:NRAMP (Natural resistance-associated macrophage protein) metal ion transporters n=1 Tax=Sporobacter termitidis DSM 10068 TaxID=1123282 RepID=A0A1M5YBU1_9FIRM|nr:Nramp family divalent metal transporter [Sporobacter termitidis]SHI09487.1 NRAMP (natural resistance-associated macrophage protein) metal ion transporters [Sporobacter termitidis DSM 10068]